MRMLVGERRAHLLRRLKETGKIVAKDVAVDLGISEDSIRRDLRDLAAEGLCQRVYGGALPASPAIVDYAARQAVEPDGKRAVAATAAALVRPEERSSSMGAPRPSRSRRCFRRNWSAPSSRTAR